MNRKLLFIIIAVVAAVVAAAIGYGVYRAQPKSARDKILSTNDAGYAELEIPHADSLIVGQWQNAKQPGWYKVYYDDYDDETKMFWGKEWHEEDSVKETYLKYHGNGWFRWERKKKMLREYATMDICDVPIHRVYEIRKLTKDSMIYFEPDYKNTIYRFGKE